MRSEIDLSKIDVVYPVRPLAEGNSELRYSLRSVAQNLPHRNIWVIGKDIEWLSSDVGVIWAQDAGKPFENVNRKLMAAVENPLVSDPFLFMMDDVFVMKKQTKVPYFAIGHSLRERLQKYDKYGSYARDLQAAREILWWAKKDEVDFEAHGPILFKKAGLKQILRKYPSSGHRRSLYCNFYKKRPTYTDDFKVYHAEDDPDGRLPYLSSAVESWRDGSKLYQLVTSTFSDVCHYEKTTMLNTEEERWREQEQGE